MDDDIIELSDMDEDEFKTTKSTVVKPSLENAHANVDISSEPSTSFNTRDAAAAPPCSFTALFSNLKKSAFYKEPEPSTSSDHVAAPSVSGGAPFLFGAQAQRVTKTGALLVSPRQRGNPLLKAICNVPWEFEEMVPDYVMGATTCALFLSLRYHNLNPDYIHERLKLLGKKFLLRVLLVQVDMVDPAHLLKHLNRLCILGDLTLMLAGSAEEAGKMLETYKMFENKPPDLIMERKEEGIHAKVQNALTTIRSVNKTDALTLVKNFGSLNGILQATPSNLELCPGFGTQKAQRIYSVLHAPFHRRLWH